MYLKATKLPEEKQTSSKLQKASRSESKRRRCFVLLYRKLLYKLHATYYVNKKNQKTRKTLDQKKSESSEFQILMNAPITLRETFVRIIIGKMCH